MSSEKRKARMTGIDFGALLRRALVTTAIVMSPGIAQAAATRTWVSGVGLDSNPCTRKAPCASFATALSQTVAGGEISVLDPGDFGPVTINKAITIRADHVEAGIQVNSGDAIIVTAGSTETVVLEGLDLDGVGSGGTGVLIDSGGTVYLIRCAIRRFGSGVDQQSSGQVFITDSTISLNRGDGVDVGGGGGAAFLNSLIANNGGFAVAAFSGTVVAAANSVFSGSPTGISLSGSVAVSYGPSNVVTGAASFTNTVPFK